MMERNAAIVSTHQDSPHTVQQPPTRRADILFCVSTLAPPMFAVAAMLPSIVSAVNETCPVDTMAKAPAHSIVNDSELPE